MRLPAKTHDRSQRRAADRATVIGLTPEEIADYGLSPSEVRSLARLPPGRIQRRNRMARLNGLDPACLEQDRALDIATALCCADCAAEGRCHLAVEEGAAPEGAAFCDNAAAFRMLAAD